MLKYGLRVVNMNKEYTYIDGKVIVSDENNVKTQREYCDNLDQILIQENVIETMEAQIEYLEKQKALLQKKDMKHVFPLLLILPIGVVLMITVGIPLLSVLLNTTWQSIQADTFFGVMSRGTVFQITLFVTTMPFAIGVDSMIYRDYKDVKKTAKGIECQLEFLKVQIEKEREKLNRLKQDKSRSDDQKGFRTFEVLDLERLKQLRQWLNMYFDLGYNGEKYYKAYTKDKLEKTLQGSYDEAGVQFVKQYIEEKGPSLVLKQKKNVSNYSSNNK